MIEPDTVEIKVPVTLFVAAVGLMFTFQIFESIIVNYVALL